MDTLQQQIFDLDRKVDRLHELVERISDRISTLILERQQLPENELANYPSKNSQRSSLSQTNGHFQSLTDHKDILVDDGEERLRLNSESGQTLSSDIQIRRLTAQLTAAYNRIAALEEQLLACRINS
ncbi:hypothetical protein NIES593_21190 [Hydrococcus rivularis NIES-593]|uniref:Uncharacterized protein n=1 Tax=Hydrococcus rivularis NIES-593 TaxID=1921803 RepID=A0A1U7H886_9CYAN|nr:hypothetical protein [Hydrococcus rivularis]OKH19157.1 hypothetical protein NIES593_21190 [Hydrococcus rivularis NIES-593]